ncbi:MAG: DUF6456 domain-containing protein [Oricola sp.]
MLRCLRLLAAKKAIQRETADPATVLLEFTGERSVRCALSDLNEMRRKGWIETVPPGETLITSEGLSALRRRDGGGHAAQHRHLRPGLVVRDGDAEAVTINDDESPLAMLARLRGADGSPWIDKAERAAGEKLRADFETAMLQPRITASWDFSRVASGGKAARNSVAELSDRALGARERVSRAIEAVGPDLGGALLDLCCFLKGLEQVERERGWPRRSAKLMLKTALGLLDRHYHPPSPQARRARRILHWGGEGYRPQL